MSVKIESWYETGTAIQVIFLQKNIKTQEHLKNPTFERSSTLKRLLRK